MRLVIVLILHYWNFIIIISFYDLQKILTRFSDFDIRQISKN